VTDKKSPEVHKQRDWLEISLKLATIVAPFVLAFWLMNIQGENQRRYEREKLIDLLEHLAGEVLNNQKYIRDNNIQPTIKDSLGQITYGIPFVRFNTHVWEVASSKDYFFLIERPVAHNVRNYYNMCYNANDVVERFKKTAEDDMQTEESAKRLSPNQRAALISHVQNIIRLADNHFGWLDTAATSVSVSIRSQIEYLKALH
jgi:uncharacterized protein YukJ